MDLLRRLRKLFKLLKVIDDIKVDEDKTIIKFNNSLVLDIKDNLIIDTNKYMILNSEQLHMNPVLSDLLKDLIKDNTLTNESLEILIEESKLISKRLALKEKENIT